MIDPDLVPNCLFAKVTSAVDKIPCSIDNMNQPYVIPGRVAQSVTCLATDACLTADPGVASSIPVRSHTFDPGPVPYFRGD